MVELTLEEARSAISGLRPPVLEDLGLAGGLASLASTIPQVDVELELADERLPEHIEVALYRIAQECLQNVLKHSHAGAASLRFSVCDNVARLEVADDGVGFETGQPAVADDGPGRSRAGVQARWLRNVVDDRTGRAGRWPTVHSVEPGLGHYRHRDRPPGTGADGLKLGRPTPATPRWHGSRSTLTVRTPDRVLQLNPSPSVPGLPEPGRPRPGRSSRQRIPCG